MTPGSVIGHLIFRHAYATVVALWLACAYWLFFRRGAEILLAHPGLLNLPSNKPWVVKVYFLLCLAGGIAGLLVMLLLDFPIPVSAPET